MMKKVILLLALFLLGNLISISFVSAQGECETHDEILYPAPDAELEIIDGLNEWRIRKGLYPLRRNSDLDKLALIQAEYIAPSMPFVKKEDLHIDRFGTGIFERAQLAGWPGYDQPELVSIAEIAAYYATTDGAFNFWQSSAPHTAAVQTPGFREVGVAVLEKNCWLTQYVVMGSRPEVLPVTIDIQFDNMYLTEELSWYAERVPFEPLLVSIVRPDGTSLLDEEWVVFAERMPLPPQLQYTDDFFVVYYDGIDIIYDYVNIEQSLVFPSQGIPASRPEPPPQIVLPDINSPNEIDIRPSTTFQSPRNGETYQVSMYYGIDGMFIINTAGEALNMHPLRIYSPFSDKVWDADWLGRYYEGDLERFGANYCFVMWSYRDSFSLPPLHEDCWFLGSGRSVFEYEDRFWLTGTFEVYYGSELLRTCYSIDRRCRFDLPLKTPRDF